MANQILLDGKKCAGLVLDSVRSAVKLLKQNNVNPKLAVLLVGNKEDSIKYVAMKQKVAKSVGIETVDCQMNQNVNNKDIINKINQWNQDKNIHGILVQLPLPEHLVQSDILNSVNFEKDVDGFNPYNVGSLALHDSVYQPWSTPREDIVTTVKRGYRNYPCTARSVLAILDCYSIPSVLSNGTPMNAVVLGRSSIAGLPITLALLSRGMTVTNIVEGDPNAKEICKRADLVVAAIGKPERVTVDWIKPGAVVIDVGVNIIERDGKRIIVGDVSSSVSTVASGYTPVPGVGPVTVAMLLDNTLKNAMAANINLFK